MLVITTSDGITAVLSPHGEIDFHTLPALLAAARQLPQSVTQVTWDFREVGFMAVAGLNLLMLQRLACLGTDRTVAVTGLREQPLRLLQLMQELFPASDWTDFLPRDLPAVPAAQPDHGAFAG